MTPEVTGGLWYVGLVAGSLTMMLPGFVLPTDLKFAEVIRPLTAGTAPCFWLIGHQSGGPFDSLFVNQNQAPRMARR